MRTEEIQAVESQHLRGDSFPLAQVLTGLSAQERAVQGAAEKPVAATAAGDEVQLSEETRTAQDEAAPPASGEKPEDQTKPPAETDAEKKPEDQKKKVTDNLWNALIEREAKKVMDLQEAGEEGKEGLDKAMKGLQAAYKAAGDQGVKIDPAIERMVHNATNGALGSPDGEGRGGDALGNGSLGTGGGNLDALNGAGGLNGGGGAGQYGGGGGNQNGGGCNGCNNGGNLGSYGGRGGGGTPEPIRPWSEEDRKFLQESLTSDPKSFQDQFAGWRQGQEGNCSAVAVIKAAMDRYDNQVFDNVSQSENGGYDIKMQDGYQLNVSPQELATARSMSNFRGHDGQAMAYATLAYAAMGKRALEEGKEGSRTYGQALNSLNNGENPYTAARLLGLKNQTVALNPRTLNGQDSVVAWSPSHCIFVNKTSGGHAADHYGTPYRFTGTDTNGWGLSGAFTLKPRSIPSTTQVVNGGGAGGGSQPAAPPPQQNREAA